MEKDLHIKNELEDLNSFLSTLKAKRKGEVIPEYFNNLEAQVMGTLNEQLASEKKMDQYFSDMQTSVLAEVRTGQKVFKLSVLVKIAAIFLMVISSLFVFKLNTGTTLTQNDAFVESLEDEELLYLLSEYSSSEELALFMADTESDILLPEETEEILQYLDEADIIEQLEL